MVTVAEEQTVGVLQCLPPRLSGGRIELGYRGIDRGGATTDFTEVVELPGTLDHVDPGTRERVLRLLSLAASLSYFKAYAPGRIEVPEGLTAKEQEFLVELTRNGLG